MQEKISYEKSTSPPPSYGYWGGETPPKQGRGEGDHKIFHSNINFVSNISYENVHKLKKCLPFFGEVKNHSSFDSTHFWNFLSRGEEGSGGWLAYHWVEIYQVIYYFSVRKIICIYKITGQVNNFYKIYIILFKN